MTYKHEVKITQELLDNKSMNDEYIFRQIYHEIIDDIPFCELKGLFLSSKIDPFSKESESRLINSMTLEHVKDEILMLKNMQLIKYVVNLTID